MPGIAIIKVGSTLPSLLSRRGDFEDWVLSGMGVDRSEAAVVDVRAGESLPSFHGISAIVVPGSHAMVTEHHVWSEQTAEWLRGAVAHEIPVLGICYGHQLLGYAFGGGVDDNPDGLEYGVVEVRLTEESRTDKLFSDLPTAIKVPVSHKQSVLSLPDGAVRLASSDLDRNQAFRIGDSAWGVQFHPEFDAEVAREYISFRREVLLAEGKDPDALIERCTDTPYGDQILRRFAANIR